MLDLRDEGPERLVYLDHSATTPLAPEVLEAMLPFLSGEYGNASAAYRPGRRARAALEEARATIARCLGAAPADVVLTGGGSESDNLALRGAARAARAAGRGAHLVTTAIEHEAVLGTARALRREGFELTIVGVDEQGRVAPEAVAAALREDTALVSVMLANNEVGTLQPVAEIAAALRAAGSRALLHSDAVQAPAWLPVRVDELGVDLLSLSAHKLYGPKGVGLLYVRPGTPLETLVTGGGQEGGRRAGTENVAGAVGLAAAMARAERERDAAVARVRPLRDRLMVGLLALEGVRLTGHPTERLPHHLSLCVAGVPADVLLLGLDMRGICASSGSACGTGRLAPSAVLAAMGLPPELATGALRLSLGYGTCDADVDAVLEVLPALVARLRRGAAAPLSDL